MKDMPYPDSRKAWAPRDSEVLLGVFLPKKTGRLPNLETYLVRLADRVQWMINQEDEDAVRRALEMIDRPDLDLLAGLEWPEGGSLPENLGTRLVLREEMISHLTHAAGLDRKMFPAEVKDNSELIQTLADVNLTDWAQLVRMNP